MGHWTQPTALGARPSLENTQMKTATSLSCRILGIRPGMPGRLLLTNAELIEFFIPSLWASELIKKSLCNFMPHFWQLGRLIERIRYALRLSAEVGILSSGQRVLVGVFCPVCRPVNCSGVTARRYGNEECLAVDVSTLLASGRSY